MRGFLFIPIVLIVTGAAGVLLCRVMGINPQLSAMAAAAVGSFIVGALAAVPILLNGSSSQAAAAQTIMQLSTGYIVSTALHTAVRLRVADLIEQLKFVRRYTNVRLDATPEQDWHRVPTAGVSNVAWQVSVRNAL